MRRGGAAAPTIHTVVASIQDIRRAAQILREGGVVAFPTETVYGLGADAMNEAAIDRVFALKGRPRTNPLIVHVSGPDMARRVAEWTPRAAALARELWPGPVSILLPRSESLPRAVTAGGDLVAVRSPNHPVALALLFEFGGPIIGPSANLSGQVSPTRAEHVRGSFAETDVALLDGGSCAAGIESTVIDVTTHPPRVLRPGVVGVDQLAEILGERVMESPRVAFAAGGALPSPGLLDRHYAPLTRAVLFASDEWDRVVHGPAAVILTHDQRRKAAPPHSLIAMPDQPAEFAAALYHALREADARGAEIICIECPPTDGPIWSAIADRLSRATEPFTSSGADPARDGPC